MARYAHRPMLPVRLATLAEPVLPPLETVPAPPPGLMVFVTCSSMGVRKQASPVNDNARPVASKRHSQIMRARSSAKGPRTIAHPGNKSQNQKPRVGREPVGPVEIAVASSGCVTSRGR